MDAATSTDIGLLILRLYIGVNFLAYGGQKLLGLFGGPGLTGWTGYVRSLRIRPAQLVAPAGAVIEAGAAILLLLGLFVPVAAAGIIATMLIATVTVHLKNGYFNAKGGFTYPLSLIVIVTALSFVGAGSYAVGSTAWQQAGLQGWSGPFAVVLGVLGATLVLATRSPAEQPARRAAPAGQGPAETTA